MKIEQFLTQYFNVALRQQVKMYISQEVFECSHRLHIIGPHAFWLITCAEQRDHALVPCGSEDVA